MKKIAIINQRYGLEINGGSEYYTRKLAENLSTLYDVEVLTTCALDYTTWENHYPPGTEEINGVTVRRFAVDRQRDIKKFSGEMSSFLEHNIGNREKEEEWIDDQGPMCSAFLDYIVAHSEEYEVFIFVTYLYYLTVRGLPLVRDKAILIPTAHDEPYIRMEIFKDIFLQPRAIGFNTSEEREFVHTLFYNQHIPNTILGMGIDIPITSDAEGFKLKHGLDEYMVYVGRIDDGKNCNQLFDYFIRYKDEHPESTTKLVLLGKAVISIPKHPDIVALGFVSEEDKFDGIKGAKMMVMPSTYESLSIVVLEAMGQGVPVVVNGFSEVLRKHCLKSNAGLYYSTYEEFQGAVDFLLQCPDLAYQMGENGRLYVQKNYTWPVILDHIEQLIEAVGASGFSSKRDIAKLGKLGFVTPWYGEGIPGGAEMMLRGVVHHLQAAGVELEILTTCVEKAATDWNIDFYPPGLTIEAGIPVRRFPVRQRDSGAFCAINNILMEGKRLSTQEEQVYAKEMINSPQLYEFMREHCDNYGSFLFIPYMFGTTIEGLKIAPEKSVVIPCLHDESYAYMDLFKDIFQKARGMIFHSRQEAKLAHKLYDLSTVHTAVLGGGVDAVDSPHGSSFRAKYNIHQPFILYAGRKDIGKNVHLLLDYFALYKAKNKNDIKLVLIGGDTIRIPDAVRYDVIDLGFVSTRDKHDAYDAAILLCQPSLNESFSIVIMESWLCKKPVLVHKDCHVTADFVQQANAGLYFGNYQEFEACINYLLANPEVAMEMGQNGEKFVQENFSWDRIIVKYIDFLTSL